MLLLSMMAWAYAQDWSCPWLERGPTDVDAGLTRVTVAGTEYRVGGARNREQFREVLQACDASTALQHFEGWRSARVGTNVGLAIPLFGWAVMAPFSAVLAGSEKGEMLRALRNDASGWAQRSQLGANQAP